MEYEVQIIDADTDKVIDAIPAKTEHSAERIERGVNINLNHEKYYTQIKQTNNKE